MRVTNCRTGALLLFVFIVHCSFQVFGETPMPLSLPAALEMASLNNPAWHAEQVRLGIAEAEVQSAKMRHNPAFMSDFGIAEYTYRIGLIQEIELGGKRSKRIALAKAQQAAVRAELDARLSSLRNEVRQAYTRLYGLQQQLVVWQGLMQPGEPLVLLTLPSPDLLPEHRVVLAEIRNEYDTRLQQMRTAQRHLNYLLNLPLETPLQLAEPGTKHVSSLDVQRLTQQAVSVRPEWDEHRQKRQVLFQRMRVERANRLPNVTVAAGPDLTTTPGPGGENYNVFVMTNVPLPIFNNQKGTLAGLAAEQRQLELQGQALQQQIVLEVAQAHDLVLTLKQKLNRYESDILWPLRQSLGFIAATETKKQSASPWAEKNLPDWNAVKQYLQAQADYWELYRDYQAALAELERATGTNF
jgi:outer membrane protein, heavy metal efflux system